MNKHGVPLRGVHSMASVTLEDAQARLPEDIADLTKSGDILIEVEGRTVAKLVPPPARKRKLGTMRGSVLYVAPDFDAIPEGFEEDAG